MALKQLEEGNEMTETTALLRALHCDLAAVCALLAALCDKSGVATFLDTEGVLTTLRKARKYCCLADELGEKERKESKC